MLCRFVGEEVFFKGVSVYLKRHMYGNTVTRDLWEGLESASGMCVVVLDSDAENILRPRHTFNDGQLGTEGINHNVLTRRFQIDN